MSKTIPCPTPVRGPAEHDIRDQIVAAASEHFSLYGYEKTTVSDLAKAIGFSKAYIYKFFNSKQAIGEVIVSSCLSEIESAVKAATEDAPSAPEKLRRMFKSTVEATLRLCFQDRKLYEIAASAAGEEWQAARAYDERIRLMIQDILRDEMGFRGVVFSDDIGMAAAFSAGGVKARIDAHLDAGCDAGDFERKTPLDETTMAIYLVMRPYINPLLLQHNIDFAQDAPAQLSGLVLRSLSP